MGVEKKRKRTPGDVGGRLCAYTILISFGTVLLWLYSLPLPDMSDRLPEDLRRSIPTKDINEYVSSLEEIDLGVEEVSPPSSALPLHLGESKTNPITQTINSVDHSASVKSMGSDSRVGLDSSIVGDSVSQPVAPSFSVANQLSQPLPERIQAFYDTLQSTPLLLSQRRLTGQRGRISCGGTGVVVFKTWESIVASTPDVLTVLPDSEPNLVQSTLCNPISSGYSATQCEVWRSAGGGATRLPACAVVGNSGRLRDIKHGPDIDLADFVIRFNNGRTKGFEKRVGTKTSLRLYNGPYAEQKEKGEITLAQLRDPATRAWVKAIRGQASLKEFGAQHSRAFMTDPEFLCLAWDWLHHAGDKPSSGMVGVLIGLKICEKVEVYGFDFTGYFNKSAWSHYYDHERPKPGREKAHPFEQELEIYKLLEAHGKLSIH